MHMFVYFSAEGSSSPQSLQVGRLKLEGEFVVRGEIMGLSAMYESLDQQKVFHGHSFAY